MDVTDFFIKVHEGVNRNQASVSDEREKQQSDLIEEQQSSSFVDPLQASGDASETTARQIVSAPSEGSTEMDLVIDLQQSTGKEKTSSISSSQTKQLSTKDGSIVKEFLCTCGERFEKSVEMAAHKRWSCKLKVNKAKCDLCDTWFASDQGLRRHMNQVHGGFARCKTCSHRFPNKMKLAKHFLETHAMDGQPMPCFVCEDSSTFNTKYELECHLIAHKYENQRKKQERREGQSNTAAEHVTLPSFHLPSTSAHSAPSRPPPPPPPPGFALTESSGGVTSTGCSICPPLHPRSPWMFPHHRPPGHGPPHAPHHGLPPFCFHGFPPPRLPPPSPFLFHQHSSSSSVPTSSKKAGSDSCANASTNETSSTQNQQQTKGQDSCQTHRHDFPYPFHPGLSTFYPPYLHKYMPHRHLRHIRKMKWKKYMKHMELEHMSRRFTDVLVKPSTDSSVQPCDSGSVKTDVSESVTSTATTFKIACKFCNKPLDRDEIHRHRRKECPALPANKCNVCDRTFKRRHHLFKHMYAESHFLQPQVSVQASFPDSLTMSSFTEDNSVLASLPERMDSVLKLKAAESAAPSTHTGEKDGPKQRAELSQIESTSRTLQDQQQPEVSSVILHSADFNKNMNESKIMSSSSVVVDKENAMLNNFKCIVCMEIFETKENICFHLREHINQAVAIQKVREWTQKSSSYFFRAEEGDSEFDQASYPSGLESEISSVVTNTTGNQESGKFSSIDTVESQDKKWQVYRTRKGHRQKGEIFVCELCSKQFSFKKDLRFHMKSAHKDSTLECPVCHKTFRWTKKGQFYERHLNSHYGVNVFKYKCDICSKTFLEKSKLKSHMSVHTKEALHKCGICGKGYGNKSSLVRHERKHTGERPYKCDNCDQSFAEKRELLRHSATHTGVAPFSCTDCGQGFTLKTSLMAHMKKKHSAGT